MNLYFVGSAMNAGRLLGYVNQIVPAITAAPTTRTRQICRFIRTTGIRQATILARMAPTTRPPRGDRVVGNHSFNHSKPVYVVTTPGRTGRASHRRRGTRGRESR